MFRQRLKVPLVAVELSFDEKFQLASGDADILVQVHSPSILWQKERLLNVALKSLPTVCDKVAWLDCDILFENDDWVERASRALDEFALVHLFQERNELPMDFTPDSTRLLEGHSESPGRWSTTWRLEKPLPKKLPRLAGL